MCELKVMSKCCCCLPLRTGLIVWGYFRLIFQVSYISLVLFEVGNAFSAKGIPILLALVSCLVANVILTVILIVGLHKKYYNLIRIFYCFNIFVLVATVLAYVISVSLLVVLNYDEHSFPPLSVNTSTIVNIVLELYFILLIRRQLLKLRHHRVYVVNDNSFVLGTSMVNEQDKKPLFPLYEIESLKEELENKRRSKLLMEPYPPLNAC